MKVRSDLLFYILMMTLSGCCLFWVIREGNKLSGAKNSVFHVQSRSTPSSSGNVIDGIKESFYHYVHVSAVVIILQIASILLFTKFLGFFLTRIGQPAVVGEIIAGILLGPSLFGQYFPGASNFLFPKESLYNLQVLGQIGLVFFMFVIGAELDLGVVRRQVRSAIIISHTSIIVPFTLGLGAAYLLYDGFAAPDHSFLPFALFIGISMSITAFPVLARIIKERGLTGSPAATMALTCAATNDVTAWCLLAVVIAIVKTGSVVSSFSTIFLAVLFVSLMLLVVRPFLKKHLLNAADPDVVSKNSLIYIFIFLLVSAYVAEGIGIHALFGAFLAGLVLPGHKKFRSQVIDKIEYFSVILLLPLFFVFSGLRTRVGLLNDGHLWVVCLGITLTAIAGKFGGTALAAKFAGRDLKDSLTIGALMNTRGLMELIVLNIGYDLGVLSPIMFTMLILMALITTFMTCPILNLLNRLRIGQTDTWWES